MSHTALLPVSPMTRALNLSPETRGMALGAAAATTWGLYVALARQGVATGLSPVDIAAFRYVTAGLVLLPWLVMGWRDVRRVGLCARWSSRPSPVRPSSCSASVATSSRRWPTAPSSSRPR